MSSMVYLMCSLPSLTYGQVPPISLDEFNADAQKQLSKKHFKALEAVDIRQTDEQAKDLSKKSIRDMLSEVQEDLLEIRKARSENRQPKLERLSNVAIAANPLEREKQIMQSQWEELSSIEAGKTFTLTEVMVYKLKLQILSRMHSFNAEQGALVLASVVDPSIKDED